MRAHDTSTPPLWLRAADAGACLVCRPLADVISTGYKRMLSPSKDFFRIVVNPRLPTDPSPAGIEALAGLYEEDGHGAAAAPEASVGTDSAL